MLGNGGCISQDGTESPAIKTMMHDALVLYLSEIKKQIGSVSDASYITNAENQVSLMRMHALFISSGKQIFEFKPSMVEAFRNTDVGDVPIGELILPYRCGFLHFGLQKEVEVTYYREKPEYIDGAYYLINKHGDLELILTTGREFDRASGLIGANIVIKKEDLHTNVSDAIKKFIADKIRSLQSTSESNNLAISQEWIQYWEKSGFKMIEGSLSLIMNSLFYLDAYGIKDDPAPSDDAPSPLKLAYKKAKESGNPKRIRNAVNHLNGAGFSLVRMCGVSDSMLYPAHSLPLGNQKRPHWRRGHWKTQRHGEGRALFKRIWVKPMLIRKDLLKDGSMDEVGGHLYLPE